MQWTIPGTTLEAEREQADRTGERFEALFSAGGLTLSQVASVTGLEPYTIQNWVKRGFLPPPRNKRYDMEQVCRVINMNILRGAMPLEQIVKLMAYLNGNLADESDDLVDDTKLLFYFVRLAARARYIGGTKSWDEALEEITGDYAEPVPGAREKLGQVLKNRFEPAHALALWLKDGACVQKVMLTVWCANSLIARAEDMLRELS